METRTPPKIRTEYVLAGIAALCLVLLIWMIILCIPHFPGKEPEARPSAPAAAENEDLSAEDPESLLHQETQPGEEDPEEIAEPTIPPEANPYTKLDFQYDRNNFLYSLRSDSYPGIDVSAFQGKIDWEQVADSGIEFAIIRLGYRGYGKSGKLVEDEYAKANLMDGGLGRSKGGSPVRKNSGD